MLLPLGITDPTEKNVPIHVSPDLDKKSRVVVIFGESSQALGVCAYRVCNGPGGVDKGSMAGFVKALQKQHASSSDSSPPGIVLANTGELWWWPEGRRGLTIPASQRIPMSSAAHFERVYNRGENSIPENGTPAEHVKYVFEKVLPTIISQDAKLDIIAIGDGADEVKSYLNNGKVWAKVSNQLNSMVAFGGYYDSTSFDCEGLKTFMKEVLPPFRQWKLFANFPSAPGFILCMAYLLTLPLLAQVETPSARRSQRSDVQSIAPVRTATWSRRCSLKRSLAYSSGCSLSPGVARRTRTTSLRYLERSRMGEMSRAREMSRTRGVTLRRW